MATSQPLRIQAVLKEGEVSTYHKVYTTDHLTVPFWELLPPDKWENYFYTVALKLVYIVK